MGEFTGDSEQGNVLTPDHRPGCIKILIRAVSFVMHSPLSGMDLWLTMRLLNIKGWGPLPVEAAGTE